MKLDVEGLREVETLFPALASILDVGLCQVSLDWSFLILGFEYEGEGLSWICGRDQQEGIGDRVRAQAERLHDPKTETVTLAPVEEGQASLDAEQLLKLAGKVKAMAALVEEAMPKGWGFALLLFDKVGPGSVWLSNAERESAAELLDEFVVNHADGKSVPPGVFGA